MKDSFLDAIYDTSGMSWIPKTMLFLNILTCFLVVSFSRHSFWAHILAIVVILGFWGGSIGALLVHFLGSFFGSSKKGPPDEFASNNVVVSRLPRGGSETPLS